MSILPIPQIFLNIFSFPISLISILHIFLFFFLTFSNFLFSEFLYFQFFLIPFAPLTYYISYLIFAFYFFFRCILHSTPFTIFTTFGFSSTSFLQLYLFSLSSRVFRSSFIALDIFSILTIINPYIINMFFHFRTC